VKHKWIILGVGAAAVAGVGFYIYRKRTDGLASLLGATEPPKVPQTQAQRVASDVATAVDAGKVAAKTTAAAIQSVGTSLGFIAPKPPPAPVPLAALPPSTSVDLSRLRVK
jgi:hypothetical protein